MAELTQYLNVPSGSKPIRSTEVAAPDVFGTAASFLGSVQGFLGERERQKASSLKSQQAAEDRLDDLRKDKALDELASGAFDLRASPEGRRLSSLQKGRESGRIDGTRYDVEVEKLVGSLINRYPDQASAIMAGASELGIENAMFRKYRMDMAIQKGKEDAVQTQQETYIKAFTDSGLDGSRLSVEQQAEKGRKLIQKASELADLKLQLDMMQSQTNLNEQQYNFDRKVLEDKFSDSYLRLATEGTADFINKIAPISANITDAQKQEQYTNFAQYRANLLADAASRNAPESTLTDLRIYLDSAESQLKLMLDGEGSRKSLEANTLLSLANRDEFEARDTFPSLFTLNAALGQAGTTSMLNTVLQLGGTNADMYENMAQIIMREFLPGLRKISERSGPLAGDRGSLTPLEVAPWVDSFWNMTTGKGPKDRSQVIEGTLEFSSPENAEKIVEVSIRARREFEKLMSEGLYMKKPSDFNTEELSTWATFTTVEAAAISKSPISGFTDKTVHNSIYSFTNPSFKPLYEETLKRNPEAAKGMLRKATEAIAVATSSVDFDQNGFSNKYDGVYFNKETLMFENRTSRDTPQNPYSFKGGLDLADDFNDLPWDRKSRASRDAEISKALNDGLDFQIWASRELGGLPPNWTEQDTRIFLAIGVPPTVKDENDND